MTLAAVLDVLSPRASTIPAPGGQNASPIAAFWQAEFGMRRAS